MPKKKTDLCSSVCVTGNRCELPKGHTGQCRFTYPNGAEEHWPRRDEVIVADEDAEELVG